MKVKARVPDPVEEFIPYELVIKVETKDDEIALYDLAALEIRALEAVRDWMIKDGGWRFSAEQQFDCCRIQSALAAIFHAIPNDKPEWKELC